MFRQVYDWAKSKLRSDTVELQKLLDKKHIRMYKTQDIKATDRPDEPISFSYRFIFDNEARRQDFLNAITKYPPQPWDPWVRWMKDVSQLISNPWRGPEGTGEVEICVEAQCLIPELELGRFQYQFVNFITKKLLLKEK